MTCGLGRGIIGIEGTIGLPAFCVGSDEGEMARDGVTLNVNEPDTLILNFESVKLKLIGRRELQRCIPIE